MALLFSLPPPTENLAKFTRDEITYLTNGDRCRFVRILRIYVRTVRIYSTSCVYTLYKYRIDLDDLFGKEMIFVILIIFDPFRKELKEYR